MSPSRRSLLLTALGALLACSCGASASENAAEHGGAPQGSDKTPSPALARVVSIGASLSAGFGVGTTFGHAVESALVQPCEVTTKGDVFFFAAPEASGEKLVSAILPLEPSLLFAPDFLFWYGYGDIPGGNEVEQRLARLERGLAQLERLSCCMVVSDFPDMQSAIGPMLRKEQVPSQGALAALNQRLAVWAEPRADVHVLSMHRYHEALRAVPEGGLVTGRVSIPEDAELLLVDQLHPSMSGQAALALWSLDLLVEKQVLRPAEVRFDFDLVAERLATRKVGLFR